MGSILSRLLTIVVGVAGSAVAGFFLWQSWGMLKELRSADSAQVSAEAGAHADSSGHGGGHDAGGHGESSGHASAGGHDAGGHGAGGHSAGGHGAGAPADGHGSASQASAGHGEASGHGAAGAAAHGAAPGTARGTAGEVPKALDRTWVSMEQMFVNLAGPENEGHSLTFQIELELFEEKHRNLLESRISTIKNAAIEVAREQSYERLKSLSGKLYFKEALVTAMNETLHAPIIRDVHLSSIFVR